MKLSQLKSNLRSCLPSSLRAESVYFYTFHKCASVLFSHYVLKNVKGLESVDYANQIFKGERTIQEQLTFRKKGYIYGPIRISTNINSPVKCSLVIPTTEPNFIRDKKAVFFVRDPRDILVSAYYSFGFTHNLSANPESRASQQVRREAIKQQSLEDYVLAAADDQIRFFHNLYDLERICERSIMLRYEDMIDDFETFAKQLVKFIPLSKKVIKGMHQKSRPKPVEDLTSHRRSGRVGGFQDRLQPHTIKALNEKLAKTLELFNYEL